MDYPDPIDILLVEDNPHDAELTLRALRKRHLANRLYLAEDGAEALDFIFCRGQYGNRAFDRLPKLILLDLKLPRIDGLEVLRLLKEDDRTRSIPVVIVTSSREDPDLQTAYALGANSYVVKPVDFAAFIDVMGQLGYYWLLINEPSR